MNQVILIGRLARDPELSYTPNTQNAMCRFTIAVDRPRRQGEDQGADFIRITVWGRQAETCDRYLSKGRQVAVQGRIQTGSYKNREGVTVYTTDVVADRVEFLGSGNGQGNGQGGYQNQGGGYSGGYQNQGGYNNGGNAARDNFGGQSYGNQNAGGFGGQDTGIGGQDSFGGNNGSQQDQGVFGGFDDLQDTFQAAEDDIPF
ncbi:MAG: single-stranded DNA-binding protein [Mogibacterium sp.]|nr:single-stranded DNA-binding protein [Mogibacterium sp.]